MTIPINVSKQLFLLEAVFMLRYPAEIYPFDTSQSIASEAVGKDVTEHVSLSYLPAKTPALETTVCEVYT